MVSLVFAGQSAHQMPAVVRRLNMLRPARFVRSGEAGPGFTTYVAAWSAANYFKDWLPYNLADDGGADVDTAAFGAFTTAPDSTGDTARLLKDTAANTQHSFVAGWNNTGQWCYGKIRLAGIFKYAGRRVVLSMVSTNGAIGCRAVFDLLNGRVAVDTAAIGSPETPWTLYPAQIFSTGGGWYLCYIEALVTFNQSAMIAGVFGKLSLDNGSGLAAESSTYAGDGSSGVYGWRSNMLPSRAWDLNTVAFLDDFDDPTMANIDLGNTKADGFDWYLANSFPSYANFGATPAGKLSVAASVLTCSDAPQALFMETATGTWTSGAPTNGYVGRGFTLPALFECRAKWDISLSNQNDAVAFWTSSLEWLVGGRSQDITMAGVEVDFIEALHGARPLTHVIYEVPGAAYVTEDQAQGISSTGINEWYAARTYGGDADVTYAGTSYHALRQNTGAQPDISPLDWGTYVQKNSQEQIYQAGGNVPLGDYENLHEYATLWLPYDADTGEPGQIVQFYDGVMCAFPMTYGPGLTGNVQSADIHLADGQQMPVLLGCGPTLPISFDWVRVTQ